MSPALSPESDNPPKVVISSARATRFVSDIDIPSKPSVLKRMDSLEDDIGALARLIMQDLALSAAVLKVVNSAWLALPNQISRIEQAVVLLGLENIKNIVRAVCFRTVMEPVVEPKLIRRFWTSSLNTAVASSVVARYLHLANPDEAYALGLFHHCGIPVLSSHFQNVDGLVRECYADVEARFLLNEIQSINVDHASIGYRVASAWNLPAPIAEAIRDHHSLKVLNLEQYSQTNSLLMCLKIGEHLSMEYKTLGAAEKDHEWARVQNTCYAYARIDERDMKDLAQFYQLNINLHNKK